MYLSLESKHTGIISHALYCDMLAVIILVVIIQSLSIVTRNCFLLFPEGDIHTLNVSNESVGSILLITVCVVSFPKRRDKDAGGSSLDFRYRCPSESQFHYNKYQ